VSAIRLTRVAANAEETPMFPAAQALIAELEAESPATRRVLERVPGDRLDWRPHERSMSVGQLALHAAGIPGRISQMAAAESFDVSQANFVPPQPASAAELLPTLEESIAGARAFLSGLDADRATAPWTLTHGERVVFTMPRLAVMRTLAFNHWYHHRGQLLVYLRLLGVPVPVVYGRSADENPFATAS
jgi:uncharacterized damage-inducible protein DinB